jgi:ribosome maturation factor RimP
VEANDIVRRVWVELGPELAGVGFDLIEVEFGRHGTSGLLRLFIDRPGGVTVDDCAAVSRIVSARLDQIDPIESEYMLEVSSPGIARPLRRVKDFEKYAGERVKVKVVTPVDGRKNFSGVLAGISEGMVLIENDGATFRLHLENVKHANLDK